MTVITDASNDYNVSDGKCCSFCGGVLTYPFLHYLVEREFFLCMDCCSRRGHGLSADLAHVEAIAKLKKLYPGETLERKRQRHFGGRVSRTVEPF
jgi:hypothetical protein